MDQNPVKLGRIASKIEKRVGQNFGDGIWVYIAQEELDQMAASFPTRYLERLNQASLMIRKPDYVGYDSEKKTLFLIREYLFGIEFKKVVLELVSRGQFYYQTMYALSAEKTKELVERAALTRLEA